MSTEQQYRVIGKPGPGVDWRSLPGDTMIRFCGTAQGNGDNPRLLGKCAPDQGWWNEGRYEILEPISPPQAAVAACAGWCGLPFGDKRVPPASDHPSMVVDSHEIAALCVQNLFVSNCPHPAYCTQACLDRAKGTEAAAPTCIRSACKAPPVAGGELCAAHAGQVEAVKAETKQCQGRAKAASCMTVHCQLDQGHAGAHQWPGKWPPPAETRVRTLIERLRAWREWRRSLCCCGNCHMGRAICRPLRDQR